jgi:hypothetical protein
MNPFNTGAYERYLLVKGGKSVELLGPLYVDVLQQNYLLLNGIPLKIQLTPQSDAFRLMSEQTGFKMSMEEIKLHVCYVDVNPSVYNHIMTKLNNDTLKYNYIRKELYPFTVQSGESRTSLNDVFQGRIPSRLTLGIVTTEAYLGNYQKNPFNFLPHALSSLEVTVNGKHLPLEDGLQLDYTKDQYVQAYDSLFAGMGRDRTDTGFLITRDNYKGGYTIYCFSIDPALVGYTQHPSSKGGNLKIDLRFAESATENLTVLVQGEFPQTIEVDKTRNVYWI